MRALRPAAWFFGAALALLAHGAALASPPPAIPLSDPERSVPVTGNALAADGRAAYADVRAGRVPFVPYARFVPRGRPYSVWLRFAVRRRLRYDTRYWVITLPRTIESAELYRDGRPPERTGMYVPYRSRGMPIASPAFRLEYGDEDGRPLLLHVTYYPEIPLIVNVRGERALLVADDPYRMMAGIFIGVLLAVALLNLYVFAAVRDESTLWYVVYAFVMVLNEVLSTGLGEQYLWPGGGINLRAALYTVNVAAFGSFLLFIRAFLRTREEARGWDRALIAGFFAVAALIGGLAILPHGETLVGWTLLAELAGMILTTAVGVVRLRAGYAPARLFVIAFVPAMIGDFANIYYNAAIPNGHFFLAANGVEIGTMLQAIILSYGIVDRLRIEQRERYRMRSLALLDPLTGLANRIAFNEELQRCIDSAGHETRSFGVLFFDLDGFKTINDAYGHRVGDEVLRCVAARLIDRVRVENLAARFGGDEFAMLLYDMQPAGEPQQALHAVANLLDDPIVVDGHAMPLGISVGWAAFPQDGASIDEMLHAADLRMYAMKQEHRDASAADSVRV